MELTSFDAKKKLSDELKMRFSHNQWAINSATATIKCFLETKYEAEHLKTLQKLVRHCTRKSEFEIRDQSILTCPREILECNVLKKIKAVHTEPEMMSEKDNAMYRELIDPGSDDKCYHDDDL